MNGGSHRNVNSAAHISHVLRITFSSSIVNMFKCHSNEMKLTVQLFIFCVNLFSFCYSSKAEGKLYRDILTNYAKLVRPVRNASEPIRVEMKVFLQQIMTLDGKNQIIELNAWLKYIWVDYRLSWDPAKYEDITSIRFAGGENQIWRPDVLLYNSANEDYDSTYKSNEVVYHTGEVNWVPPGIFRASCKMDITYFPFDDQTCYLKFGSWTYHGLALDLHIIQDNEGEELGMDLSTYTPSGEWHLISAPAKREVTYTPCCPEPYSTVTFYMNLRRRTIFYLFNIVLPSLLISVMTLMGFCLPAHDMSEKIGYQTTILLSICFFVTIVSEMTPPTSEAVPLLGMFFSTLTLIVAVSTAFTITVLNFRYRQSENTQMSVLFRRLFLVWIPWLLMMKRPGVVYTKRKADTLERDDESFIENCEDVCCPNTSDFYFTSIDSDFHYPLQLNPRPLLKKMYSIPTEHLHLDRKVGEGILKNQIPRFKKSATVLKLKRTSQFEKYVKRCMYDASERKQCEYTMLVVQYYRQLLEKIKYLRKRMDKQEDDKFKQLEKQKFSLLLQAIHGLQSITLIKVEEWKFAAMALDRLCLVIFTLFISISVSAIAWSTPHFEP